MNQEDNNQFARRQKDRTTQRLQRNLDWGQLASDIELFEHKPSQLSDALESPKGELRLTPGLNQNSDYIGDEDNSVEAAENVTSLQSIRSLKPDACLLYTSPSPRDRQKSRMPSSA